MQRLIIDTDPGVDDAQAILMAAAHPAAKIEAILAVGGNVGLDHTVRNALTIVEVVEQEIPVYAGCDRPFVAFQEDAAIVHGSDGLGNSGYVPMRRTAEKTHAVNALIALVNAEPDQFTLVTLGPLTNIAVALKLDPDLPNKIKRVVMMGGAVTGKGNVGNISAEFNIYHDPEAAYVVFEAWARAGKMIEVYDWEATVRHAISGDTIDEWATIDTPRARFFSKVSAFTLKWVREELGQNALFGADPQAMAVALEPTIVTHSEDHYLTVATQGAYTRGLTVVDWNDSSKQPKNARIVIDIDRDRYERLLYNGIQ
jgi:purine nucleosidase